MPQIGDIVILWGSGVRKVVVDSRTEIVPRTGDWNDPCDLRARTVYRLAGMQDRWFSDRDIAILSPRLT